MAQASFREILSQFLEEESQNSPQASRSTPDATSNREPETPSFHWQRSEPSAPTREPIRRAYPRPTPAFSQTDPVVNETVSVTPALPSEPNWTVAALTATEQSSIRLLVKLGAQEIGSEISESLLKKVYRRLARRWHPDGNPQGQEEFLTLQSIYEELSERLKTRASELACGSESASAAKSRRQDAA